MFLSTRAIICFNLNARSTSVAEAVPLSILNCKLANSSRSDSISPPGDGADDLDVLGYDVLRCRSFN